MRRELSYQFDLDIERVHLIINMKCDVQVWWKSGKRKIATKNSLKLTGTQKYFDVRQKLSIIAKIGVENGVLQQKKTQLLIILFTSQNTSKLGGRVYLNLAQYVSPENLTATVIRKCERSLENCPDEASKIVFNLSCKYIEESVAGMGSQNANDISFQANNFSTSIGTGSSFGRSTADMTFRPQKEREQYNQKWQSSNAAYQVTQSMRQHSPKQKKKIDERQWEKQKVLDTPSWDRSYRQKQPFQPPLPTQSGRGREKEQQKVIIQGNNSQRPLQFSFNPMNASDRQKLGLDNSQIIRDLKLIVEQRGQTIRNLQEQLSKVRAQHQQKSQKSSSKSLALLNELNSTNVIKEQLQRQKSQLSVQNEQLKEENKKLEQKYKSMHFQYSQLNNEYMNKLEQRKKMIEELNIKLEECDKRANKYQDELFKRQNQIITKQKQFIAAQISKQSVNKEQTEKLKNISAALKDLQNNFENVFAEKQQLKRKLTENNFKFEKFQDVNNKISKDLQKTEIQLQRQKEKYKLIEAKYIERESVILQIENQFKKFSTEKMQSLRQKEEELSSLRQKFNLACKKMEDVVSTQQSMKNAISEKNIRIKSLEEICSQLERSLEEKQQLIRKAKQYVSVKQQEAVQKNQEIKKRDEFIQKCKAYMDNKEKQFSDFMNGIKSNNSSETANLKQQLKQKQTMLQEYINQRHVMQRRIEDMEHAIDRLKNKIIEYEDEVDELQRKHESQEGTLKDLVKKNLDMQIQLNIKDYEIQAFKSSR